MAQHIVVCVNSNNYQGMGAVYVNRLFDMVRRNLRDNFEGKFVCFTDDPEGIAEGVEIQHITDDLRGWFNKIFLFKKGLFPDDARILFIDLDTLICASIDKLFQYTGNFATLRDFYRPDGLGPAIMLWEAGKMNWVWDSFEAAGKPNITGGDQAWLELLGVNADILQDMWPDFFVSYKADCKLGLPQKAGIVCFHGEPKNHDCGSPWVETIWKIGGLTKFDTEVVANIPEEEMTKNIKHALTLDVSWLTKGLPGTIPAVIVGGGPSVKRNLERIAEMQRCGAVVFSMNGSYKYLAENGIYSDYHVIVDAREANKDFVPFDTLLRGHLYASTCHPEVFARAKGHIILWHPAIVGIDHLISHITDKPKAFIGGGCNVGLKTMVLAYTMGFRKLFVFGFDSSYEDDDHHAYEQALNGGERVLEVTAGDYKFRAAPWMITQADEFQNITAPELIRLGCEIEIFGNGLLPYLAYKMSAKMSVAQEG